MASRNGVRRDCPSLSAHRDFPRFGPRRETRSGREVPGEICRGPRRRPYFYKQRLTEGSAENALEQAGVDVERAKQDLALHQKQIDEILARNNWQALDFEFQGPPSFIIGHYRVRGILDSANLIRAIADARAAEKKRSEFQSLH
jgi:hypothetical protein